MSEQLTLSVVDQSPIRKGGTPSEALWESVGLAQHVENVGYSRYWVAEHHSAGTFAGTSPEILIGQILAHTDRIRVGSGGVMLSHYSSLKIAEQFRILDSFYPGRVDLGIGRAPGSDQRTLIALAYPKRPVEVEHFPQQVADLIGYLHGALQPNHPFATIKAQPGELPDSAPEVWLLGSSAYSAGLAAYLGLPFAFADFFGNTGAHGPSVAERYRQEFKPSALCPEPRLNVTLQVLCAPTEEEAAHLATSRNVNRARRVLEAEGSDRIEGLLPPDEAAAVPLSERALEHLEEHRGGYHDGDPEQGKAAIETTAERYGTSDVGIVTITYRLEDRMRSYELIAEAFGLPGALSGTEAAD